MRRAKHSANLAAQTCVGLGLASIMFVTWIGVHVWAMFFFSINGATWPLVPLIFALQCWLSVGMFIVAHDAMHGSLAPGQPRLNGAIGAVVLFLYAGFGWRKMRDAHFDHHRHVGTADDPDFNSANPQSFWPWYSLFLKRYFGWQSIAFVWAIVLFYFFVAGVAPENIALLYGFPAIASSIQLFYFGTYRPHRHEAAAFSDHHKSRTNSYGTIASLFSCFHFGYHHEHHLSPGVPWWALPQRHKEYLNDRA